MDLWAEEDVDKTSFVNENFDDLQSEGSKDSLKKSYDENPFYKEPVYDEPQVITKITGAYSKNNKPEHKYDELQLDQLEPKDDKPNPQDGASYLNTSPTFPDEDIPTLEVEEEDSYNPFSTDIKPSPALPHSSTTIAPSLATANVTQPKSDSPGSGKSSDEGTHRPLPIETGHAYDVIRDNTLRSETEDNLYDLQVNIVDRVKHVVSKTDSYISYKIETTSLRPRHLFEDSQYSVWRRYRDFEWLHHQIEKNHPTLIVPPLPGKQITRYFDHMSETFLEERQRCLDQFLWRLVIHPFFSYDHNLKMFLTADNETFSNYVTESASGSRLLGMMSSSVKQATTSIRLKNPDPDFGENCKYFSDFSEKLGTLERVDTRLQSDRKDLSTSCEELSSVAYSWANSESLLCEGIRKLGGAYEANSSALNTLNEGNSYSFQLALRMYQYYATSAVSAIKRRDALQLEYETATDERDRKKKLHEEAVQAGKTDKVMKISSELEKIGVTAEHTQDSVTQANEQLRVDIEKWKDTKDKELAEIFVNWSDNQIQYHERMYHEWEDVLLLLRQLGHDISDSTLLMTQPSRTEPISDDEI